MSSYLFLPVKSAASTSYVPEYHEMTHATKRMRVADTIPFSMKAYGKVKMPAPRMTVTSEKTDAFILPCSTFDLITLIGAYNYILHQFSFCRYAVFL